ncbi:MAG TPA: MHYT domain-containing protein [Trichocoleus sp.]
MLNPYNMRLVALSILMATLASYTAFDFAGHVSTATGWRRTAWLVGGAIAMGAGIWSMHFVGMLAYSFPFAVRYDLLTVVASGIPAVLASGLGLCLVSRRTLGLRSLIAGSTLMGLGISTMHYLGMASLRMPALARYNLSIVAAALAISVAVSFVALWLAFCLRHANTILESLHKVVSALLMGMAVASMHYTGMASTQFGEAPLPTAIFPSLEIDMAALPSLMSLDMSSLGSLISTVAGAVIATALLIALEAKVIQQATLLGQLQAEISQRQRAEQDLKQILKELRAAQAVLVHTEKMSSLGRLVAGISHEVNNPLGFIMGNLGYLREFTGDLLNLASLCREHTLALPPSLQQHLETLDLDFIAHDTPRLLNSMEHGASRIQQLVVALRNFSRLDEAALKPVHLTEGLEDALHLLRHRFAATAYRPEIEVLRQYGDLPKVECYAGQLNQVFVKLLENAVDSLDRHAIYQLENGVNPAPHVTVTTTWAGANQVLIRIADNGGGISPAVASHIFDPFFTTKPIGQGTGMGLAIAHQVVAQAHNGTLTLASSQVGCTVFEICLPLQQTLAQRVPVLSS